MARPLQSVAAMAYCTFSGSYYDQAPWTEQVCAADYQVPAGCPIHFVTGAELTPANVVTQTVATDGTRTRDREHDHHRRHRCEDVLPSIRVLVRLRARGRHDQLPARRSGRAHREPGRHDRDHCGPDRHQRRDRAGRCMPGARLAHRLRSRARMRPVPDGWRLSRRSGIPGRSVGPQRRLRGRRRSIATARGAWSSAARAQAAHGTPKSSMIADPAEPRHTPRSR